MSLVQNPSTLTWGTAKIRVARTAGVQDDDDWKLVAASAIKTALHRLEIKRNWAWLMTNVDLTLVDNQNDYSLPAPFRKPYTCWLDDRRLIYLPERYARDANPQAAGTPFQFYLLFNLNNTGKISFFPGVGAPNNSAKVHVDYLRAITIPSNVDVDTSNDSAVIDVPAQYEDVILCWAKSIICMDKGGKETEAQYFEQLGSQMYNEAVRDEVDIPDADLQIVPETIRNNGWNPNSLAVLLNGVDPSWP